MTDAEVVRKVRRRVTYRVGRVQRTEYEEWFNFDWADGPRLSWDEWISSSEALDDIEIAQEVARDSRTTAELLASGNPIVWELTNAVIGT